MTVGMSLFWRAAARQPGARYEPPKSLEESTISAVGIIRHSSSRPKTFLFPGRDDDSSLDPTVLHAAYRSAVKSVLAMDAS
jgi:hypothetical protein